MSILICSTQYPYLGGSATLAYDLNKYFLKNDINSKICYFLTKSEINKYKNLKNFYNDIMILPYIFNNKFNNSIAESINQDFLENYDILKKSKIILAVNYGITPLLKTFNYKGYIIYLIVGSPELTLGENCPINNKISYINFVSNNKINKYDFGENKHIELNSISLNHSDNILANSMITKNIYEIIYKEYKEKKKY